MRHFAAVGRLHIVAIASLGLFTFGWLFFGRYGWLLAAVCALDWYLVNLLNKVVDLAEDRVNAIPGTDFVAEHRTAILRGGLGVLVSSLVIGFFVAPTLMPLRIAFHALGFAYNWPLLPGKKRIKQLYFWKNTASAIGFMLTVFGYPLAAWKFGDGLPFARGVTWATVAFTGVFFFLFELSYEVIYDLRDRPGDLAADVRTYPVVHGERGAVRIIDGLVAVAIATLVGGFVAHIVPWRAVVMVVAPIWQIVAYKRALARSITSDDCVRLTWVGAGMLVAYHLWIVVGLPGVSA